MPVNLTDILGQATPFTELKWLEREVVLFNNNKHRIGNVESKSMTTADEVYSAYGGFMVYTAITKFVRGGILGIVAGGILANYVLGVEPDFIEYLGGAAGASIDVIQYAYRGINISKRMESNAEGYATQLTRT
ncbi:MAG: hypothetical protein AABX51_06315 [Nanoarchaeota archaeon]